MSDEARYLKHQGPAKPRNGEPSSPRAAAWELAPGGEWPVEAAMTRPASWLRTIGTHEPQEIACEALDKLVHHLTAPARGRRDWAQRLYVIGAYRFYVIEFAPRPDVTLYLQMWSKRRSAAVRGLVRPRLRANRGVLRGTARIAARAADRSRGGRA